MSKTNIENDRLVKAIHKLKPYWMDKSDHFSSGGYYSTEKVITHLWCNERLAACGEEMRECTNPSLPTFSVTWEKESAVNCAKCIAIKRFLKRRRFTLVRSGLTYEAFGWVWMGLNPRIKIYGPVDDIDEPIIDVLNALHERGVTTYSSCVGHGKRVPHICLLRRSYEQPSLWSLKRFGWGVRTIPLTGKWSWENDVPGKECEIVEGPVGFTNFDALADAIREEAG